MAIFHCTISNISRAKGSSVCASAAYITGEKIYEERTGQTYTYGRKQRIFDFESANISHVILPKGVPEAYNSVSVLANAIENFERRDDSRPGKKEEFALPKEATRDQKIAIAQKHINACYVSKGYPCIWSLHDIDGENPHAHVIIINRKLDEAGNFEKHKTKTVYARDENGEKIPVYETKRDDAGKIMKDKNGRRILALDADGQPIQSRDKNGKLLYKRTKVEESYLDQKDLVKSIRKNCEECINEYLEDGEKVDCRTLKAQGVERIPTIHEGHAARGMEARGEISERCELNREIEAENAKNVIAQLRAKIEALGARLVAAMDRILTHHEDHGEQTTDVDHHEPHEYDSQYDYVADPEAVVNVQSDNPLISQLVTSQNYELTTNNLKAVAQTIKVLQEHGIDSYEKFKTTYTDLTKKINTDLLEYTKTAQKTKGKLEEADKKLAMRRTMNEHLNVYKTAASYTKASEEEGGKHGTKRTAEKYKKDHAEELDDFIKAREYLRKHSPDGNAQTTKEIRQEEENLKKNQETMAASFRAERIEGWDLFHTHQTMTAILGPDPAGWHPVNTLDYRIEHDLPKELAVYRGHDFKTIYNPTWEEEHQTIEREKKKDIKREGPSL